MHASMLQTPALLEAAQRETLKRSQRIATSERAQMQRRDCLAQRMCERGIGKQKQNFSVPGSCSSSSSSETPGVAWNCEQVEVDRQLRIEVPC